MKKIVSTVAAFGVAFGLPAFASASSADTAKQAHIHMPQARAIALKAFPGHIVNEELEKEKGGSGLRYSFVIAQGKVSHEVGVDAKTGKVLENSVETAAGND